MTKVSTTCLAALFAACLGLGSAAHAADCFKATGALGDDAQTMRQKAADMGWAVGVPASLSASGVVKSKVALYPKGSVEVCMQPDAAGELAIRIQASSADAGKAEWHKLPGKRKG